MPPFAAAFNHVLAQNAWAQAKLAPFAGKQFQLSIAPARLNFLIDASGSVQAVEAAVPDATLSTTPSALLRYLSAAPRDLTLIAIEGDAAFGAALREIMGQLSWEAEEDLSRVVGDVLAHRIAGVAKHWFAWQEQAVKRFALSATEYWTEEQPLLAKPNQLAQFGRDVQALDAQVTQLENRIGKLG